MTYTEINAWLSEHQLLVTLVATPVLSLLVGAAAAWYSGKRVIASARTERIYQSTIEISRFRQAWIDALRDDLAEFAGISVITFGDVPPPEKIERICVLAMRIRMRMNREDPDYDTLTDSLAKNTEGFMLGKSLKSLDPAPLVPLSQAILKREWERLKDDLRKAEK